MDAEPHVKRELEPYIRKWARSIVPRPRNTVSKTLMERVSEWLLPWELSDYPGKRRGMAELLGISWLTVREYRRGRRPLPKRLAVRLLAAVGARVAAGELLLAELRQLEASYADRRRARGWQIVKDRAGLVRDGRPVRTPKVDDKPKRPRGRPRKHPRPEDIASP